MNETTIKEEEIAAAKTELLRIAGLVSVPSDKNEATFRQKLTTFVNSLPPESALRLAAIYKQVANIASGEASGLTAAGLKPADMVLGAVFGAAQKGKAEINAGDTLGAGLDAQQRNLQEGRVEV